MQSTKINYNTIKSLILFGFFFQIAIKYLNNIFNLNNIKFMPSFILIMIFLLCNILEFSVSIQLVIKNTNYKIFR